MERRRERRGLLDQSVQVTLLRVPIGAIRAASHERIQFTAQTIDQSGKGMRLLTPIELHPGATLKIETDDLLLLAEVCHSTRVNETRFAVGVQVSQSLQFTNQLRRLSKAVAASSASANSPVGQEP